MWLVVALLMASLPASSLEPYPVNGHEATGRSPSEPIAADVPLVKTSRAEEASSEPISPNREQVPHPRTTNPGAVEGTKQQPVDINSTDHPANSIRHITTLDESFFETLLHIPPRRFLDENPVFYVGIAVVLVAGWLRGGLSGVRTHPGPTIWSGLAAAVLFIPASFAETGWGWALVIVALAFGSIITLVVGALIHWYTRTASRLAVAALALLAAWLIPTLGLLDPSPALYIWITIVFAMIGAASIPDSALEGFQPPATSPPPPGSPATRLLTRVVASFPLSVKSRILPLHRQRRRVHADSSDLTASPADARSKSPSAH